MFHFFILNILKVGLKTLNVRFVWWVRNKLVIDCHLYSSIAFCKKSLNVWMKGPSAKWLLYLIFYLSFFLMFLRFLKCCTPYELIDAFMLEMCLLLVNGNDFNSIYWKIFCTYRNKEQIFGNKRFVLVVLLLAFLIQTNIYVLNSMM